MIIVTIKSNHNRDYHNDNVYNNSVNSDNGGDNSVNNGDDNNYCYVWNYTLSTIDYKNTCFVFYIYFVVNMFLFSLSTFSMVYVHVIWYYSVYFLKFLRYFIRVKLIFQSLRC